MLSAKVNRKPRDVQGMIEMLGSHAAFDHTEYENGKPNKWDYFYGREDPQVATLRAELQQLSNEKKAAETSAKEQLKSAQKASAEREKTLRVYIEQLEQREAEREKALRQYIEELEQKEEDLESNGQHLQQLRQKLLSQHIDAIPATFLYEKFQGQPAYNINHFVILSPNKQSVYHISLKEPIPMVVGGGTYAQWIQAYGHISNTVQLPNLRIEHSVDRHTVSDLLACCHIDISDKLLNFDWEEILDPKKAKAQSIIILESEEERVKRKQEKEAQDRKDEEERRRRRTDQLDRPSRWDAHS